MQYVLSVPHRRGYVVGYHDYGYAVMVVYILYEPVHFHSNQWIQTGSGLVEKNELPRGAERPGQQRPPLLPAGQDVVTITSADDLPLLLRMFPAPALTPTTSGWPLVVGTCYDVAFENGMGRILTLTYQASDTIQVTLTSIYPARAIALLEKGDYRISASLGVTLAGRRSIRMENAESIRLHAQGEEALYIMITPLLEENSLRSIAGQMTLTEGE